MSDKQLTERQKQIYDIIKEKINNDGFPPTVREILKITGETSTDKIYRELKVLEKLGYIQNDATKPRTRTIKNDENKVIFVPIISKLVPNKNYLNTTGMYPLPNDVGTITKFGYRMKGYSMIGKGIYDQDMLFFSDNEASDGDIVIAYADKVTVVAEISHDQSGKLYLKVHNSALSDIHPKECIVCGKLSGVFRAIK